MDRNHGKEGEGRRILKAEEVNPCVCKKYVIDRQKRRSERKERVGESIIKKGRRSNDYRSKGGKRPTLSPFPVSFFFFFSLLSPFF